ncbi:DUF4384 domain-containing protein [Antarcticimicrobium sediminis]|uniref:DUF4384 domain-containing protein n=1 Tax=Antarcticimicrobium sediminis TaxID=2546227 RepID=A0A4R5ES73_9RHOB|nr:DUF4384 domain-containing protein [Antarcticimicrobium sediminis]TDE37517.1 DUF4384 domain-containing protein [Antarcticimicrobium sediminis]
MSRRPLVWAAGLGASMLAHGGLLGLVLMTIRPGQMEDQPQPETRLDVQAYQLDRVEAPERRPDTEAAQQLEAQGAALGAGAIPRSRAQAQAPATQAAQPTPTQGRKLTPDQTRPEPAVQPSAAVPPIQTIAAQTDPARARPIAADAQLTPRTPPAQTTTAVTASPTSVQPAVARAADLGAILPAALPTPSAAPEARPLSPQRAQGVQAQTTAPSAERVTATLAFQGGDGEVDPVSLAAFQSFVRPDAAGAQTQALRDGVAGLLSGVPCGRLQVGFDPETATLQVNGHIPEDDMRAPVLAALRAQMGADIAVSDNILILPRPQCGALSGIATVGLAQSTDQITNPLLIGAGTQARVFSYVGGDPLSFDLTAPDYAAWVYVDYFDADGQVLHLVPNDHVPPRLAEAKSALRVGARTEGDDGLRLLIGPPYGREIAVAFAASAPLYEGLRPLSEPAAPYLDWLKSRVAEARARDPGFKGEWVYFFVRTSEK